MTMQMHPDGPHKDVRIDELHVWLCITRDGDEGILSTDMPLPFGIRHAPLLTSDKALAESLEPLARQAQALSAKDGVFIEIELRTFIRKP